MALDYKSFKSTQARGNKGEEPEKNWVKWTKFCVVTVLYLLFLYWVESWIGLIVVPFIYDIYISHKIHWTCAFYFSTIQNMHSPMHQENFCH